MSTSHTPEKRSAGIFFSVIHPHYEELTLILRVRTSFNPETVLDHRKYGIQSLRGVSQPTAHGKLVGDETVTSAIVRELGEEIGCFWEGYCARDFDGSETTPIRQYVERDEHITVYHLHIPWKWTAKLPEGSDIYFLRKHELGSVQSAYDFERLEGVESRNVIAMFPGQLESARMIFEQIEEGSRKISY